MILELGPEGANGRGSCFGLGCLQWTSYERIKRLVAELHRSGRRRRHHPPWPRSRRRRHDREL